MHLLIHHAPLPIAFLGALIDTPVFYNLAPRPIKYRVSVPISRQNQIQLKSVEIFIIIIWSHLRKP